jgi:hypothetical protein
MKLNAAGGALQIVIPRRKAGLSTKPSRLSPVFSGLPGVNRHKIAMALKTD